MNKQPSDTTCGPTCLHAVYDYYGDDINLEKVVAETQMLDSGGTLGVCLANHALARGYGARIYTYNLQLFDPTWFQSETELTDKIQLQMQQKSDPRLQAASLSYIEYLRLGGQLRFLDLGRNLLHHYLGAKVPILTGLSSTYLYQSAREYGPNDDEDDILGEPQGHFVVICGYDPESREVQIADPYGFDSMSGTGMYSVSIERAMNSILLGVLTYDANLLLIYPKNEEPPSPPCKR